jgi:hypothetical protein
MTIAFQELTGLQTGGAPILAYKFEMDQAGGGSGPWTTVDESLLTQDVITGLVEGLPYFFRYSALNAHGYSDPSNVYYSLMATIPD